MEHLIRLLSSWLGSEAAGTWLFVAVVAAVTFGLGAAATALAGALLDPVRGRARALLGEKTKQGSSVLARAGRAAAPYVLPKSGEKSETLRLRLVRAGYRSDGALVNYYALKTLLAFGLPVVTLAGLILARVTTDTLLVGSALSVLLGVWLPHRWLQWAVDRRKRILYAAMPDALDLLVVCTEAGYGLKQAIQRVADELEESHPELAAELGLVNAEMRAGVDRVDALRHLAERTDLDDIGGLVALLAQSLRFGTSVADSLRIYADEFRDKRSQRAEETAATISTRMVFPLVLCMFPAFFLVAIGPAVVGVMGAFDKM